MWLDVQSGFEWCSFCGVCQTPTELGLGRSFYQSRYDLWCSSPYLLGPIQFYGPSADCVTKSLHLEENTYLSKIEELRTLLKEIRTQCLPGCDPILLDNAIVAAKAMLEQIQITKRH